MLRKEENELLAQVGPGTPMGSLMRQYWIPVLFATELPAPDCPPLRVRLLGEDLIAFRDSSGSIGLTGEHCPHRGASLFFGRNEEAGLRCVYHGWKFDVSGRCMDMPNEPPESNFKDKVKVTAYPCRERGGLVWTYMGPLSEPPALSDFEWNTVPEGHYYVSKRVALNNWLQGLEGAIDTSHVNFLHRSLSAPGEARPDPQAARLNGAGSGYMMRDSHPRFESLNTEAGVLVGARRLAEEDSFYWRINPFLMPFYTMFPSTGTDPACSGHAWVPVDDFTTLVFHFTYHPTRPLTDSELNFMRHGNDGFEGFHPRIDGFLPATSRPFGAWHPVLRAENLYGLDYQAQRTSRFSGIPSGWAQDSGVQEGMGLICDRTREHLGTSDAGIISVRRYLLNAAKQGNDLPAPGSENPAAFSVRPAALLVPREESVWPAAARAVKVRAGVSFASV